MPHSYLYFLGSRTDFTSNGQLIASRAEGSAAGAEVDIVVASGKAIAEDPNAIFTTTLYFTYDKTNPNARLVLTGGQSYWPDTSQGDTAGGYWVAANGWVAPAISPTAYPGYSDSENWFNIGAGWNPVGDPDPASTVRSSQADGHTTAGSNVISSTSAAFAATDVGGTVYDTLNAVNPAGAKIMAASAGTASLDANCLATTTNDVFRMERATNLQNFDGLRGYNPTKLENNNGIVLPGWRDSMIYLYAPKLSEVYGIYPNAHTIGIVGGNTRCSDDTNSTAWVVNRNWGYHSGNFQTYLGYVNDNSQAYGWGVALLTLFWDQSI